MRLLLVFLSIVTFSIALGSTVMTLVVMDDPVLGADGVADRPVVMSNALQGYVAVEIVSSGTGVTGLTAD